MNEEEIVQSIAAYALNALEPDEMAEVQAYLERRPDLRQRAAELADVATQMAYVAPDAAPTASLKARIMEVAMADVTLDQDVAQHQQPAESSDRASVAGAPENEPAGTPPEQSIFGKRMPEQTGSTRPTDLPMGDHLASAARQPGAGQQGAGQPGVAFGSPNPAAPLRPARQIARDERTSAPRSWFGNAMGWKLATLAALAAAIVLAIINAQMLQEADGFRQQLTTLQGNTTALETQLAELQTSNASLEAEVASAATNNQSEEMAAQMVNLQAEITALQEENQQLLTDYNEGRLQQASLENQLTNFAQTQTIVQIFGTEDTPDALGALFVGPDENLIALRGLTSLPAEQTYELWLIDADGTAIPAGLLGADAPQHTAINVSLPADITGFSAVAVSIEPAEGSTQPTGPIVMLGTRA